MPRHTKSRNWHGKCIRQSKGQLIHDNIRGLTRYSKMGDIMKTTNTRIKNETEISTGHETSKFALAVGMTMAGMVGIWGLTCMISGLMNGGLGNLLQGLMTAITGN